MSDNINPTIKPASDILPPDNTPEVLLSDIFEKVEQFLSETSDIDANSRNFFIKGLSKSIDTDFSITELLKDQSRLVHDYIKTTNRKMSLSENAIIKAFFDSLLIQYELLTALDISVASNDLFAYIIGYNLRVIKNNYDRKPTREV
tara:strand:- start:313 stop:750 length:438 start_codon:yes stop_codon:yes gene_type:complete